MRAALLIPLLLAACSDGGGGSGDRNADGKISNAEIKAEAARIQLDPGEWETRVEVGDIKMAGVSPEMLSKMKPTIAPIRSCMTEAEMTKMDPSALTGGNQGNCDVKRYTMANGKIDAAMTCSPQGAPGTADVEMTGTYTSQAYSMDVKSSATVPGMASPVETVTRVTSRRVGECQAGKAGGS